MEWLKNLSDAIDYIEQHLDKEISYEEAAQIACCSTYYFQRMFTYVAGITLADYIRRRRMSQAAFDLQRTDMKVLDVALTYGYTSPTSFNRAFQSVHGITPTAAKHMGNTLQAYPPITFKVETSGGKVMAYHITEKEAFRIVGTRVPLVEDMQENHKNVPNFWMRTLQDTTFHDICQLSKNEPKTVLGVSVYENPLDIYYYIAAVSDGATPKGMYAYEIPAATWVVFSSDGYFKESVQSIFQRFYKEWLLFSGYEYAELPDIEVYPVMEGKVTSGYCEVWIAIKKVKEK